MKGIVKDVDHLEGDYRKFKGRQINRLDEMGFMMTKLLKAEKNSNLDEYLNDFLRREIRNTAIFADSK